MGNTLFFSNKTSNDIIYEKELKKMLADQAIFILTKENKKDYTSRYINESFIKQNIQDFTKNFYICGPDKMIEDIRNIFSKSGSMTESLVFEK